MISCNADSVTRFFSAKGLQVDTERTTQDYAAVAKDHVEDYTFIQARSDLFAHFCMFFPHFFPQRASPTTKYRRLIFILN